MAPVPYKIDTRYKIQELYLPNVKITLGICFGVKVVVRSLAHDLVFLSDEPISFKLTFRQAENYPVDLYFLLDLSYTMVEEEAAQKSLIALGKDMRKYSVLC